MTPSKSRQSALTAEKILDVAEKLIQTRGYSAISYQDIADAIDMRKASIHYHYPSKADLGLAVIDRYAERFDTALRAIGDDTALSSVAALERYLEPFIAYAKQTDQVCLCGALAGEILVLPPAMRERVERFFAFHQTWLAKTLKRGADRGEFHLPGKPKQVARLFFAALQGALLVKRATGRADQVFDVIAMLRRQLSPEA